MAESGPAGGEGAGEGDEAGVGVGAGAGAEAGVGAGPPQPVRTSARAPAVTPLSALLTSDAAGKSRGGHEGNGRRLGPAGTLTRLGENRRRGAEAQDQGYQAAMKTGPAPRDDARHITTRKGERHAPRDADQAEGEVLLLMRIPPAHPKHRERRHGKQEIAYDDSSDAFQHRPTLGWCGSELHR